MNTLERLICYMPGGIHSNLGIWTYAHLHWSIFYIFTYLFIRETTQWKIKKMKKKETEECGESRKNDMLEKR